MHHRNTITSILVLLFLALLLVFGANAFGRPRSHSTRKSGSTKKVCSPSASAPAASTKNSSADKQEIWAKDLNPYYNCGLALFGVVQKIPYQAIASDSNHIDVNLSSGCVRCGMCLAIAERINQSLVDAHEAMTSQWFNDTEVKLFLRDVCDNEFNRYTLREIDGERYIGDCMPGATLVHSNANGHWERTLRNKCHDMMDDVGIQKLYKHWRGWWNGASNELADILCRGDTSKLRDCRSISGDAKIPDTCRKFYRSSVKVTAQLTCN